MSGVSQVSVRPGPSQPRGRLPVAFAMASAVLHLLATLTAFAESLGRNYGWSNRNRFALPC
jgi:hypothetical protein